MRCAARGRMRWTYRAASSPRGASRTRRRSPRSSKGCAMRMYDLPDARGHFGPYGGVFVSETLVQALDELKSAYARCQHDPEFQAEFAYELKHYVGRPSPVYHARRWSERFGGAQVYLKREDSQPYRRAQDQQRDRPGAAGAPHGQAAGDRRDRRRHAWRGGSHHCRPLRHGMRGLHGGRGRQAPGAERLSHEAAGRDRGAGGKRLEDAEGRVERGDARLGDQRRAHLTTSSARWPGPIRIR